MTDAALTAAERAGLLQRAFTLHERRFPAQGVAGVNDDDFYQSSEGFYHAVGEYFDRLPRVVMSACPFCEQPVVRAFDPWGVDGLWWGVSKICEYQEPQPCEHFQVLLGAVRFDETTLSIPMLMKAQPGPEVPFVVPRLLELPNMIAVVGGLPMDRNGAAHPIAYFSDTQIDPLYLHQGWCRDVHWFTREGKEGWTYANDVWDFDLGPYVQRDQLRWVLLNPDDPEPPIHRASDGDTCPFVGLAGEQRPQVITGGRRSFMALPDGRQVDPFDT